MNLIRAAALILAVIAPALISRAEVEAPDTPGLPRVLLIGDSISEGYTPIVRSLLKGRANVHHPAENCKESAYGLAHLDQWLGPGHWDVIHFNFGLHDVKYLDAKGAYVSPQKGRQVASPEEYGKNLRLLVSRLKKTGARLIFATSTPVPAGTLARIQGDKRRYNAVAVRVMRENGVPVDDLGAYAVRRQAQIQRPHDVHFTPQGYEELAGQVANSILAVLRARR